MNWSQVKQWETGFPNLLSAHTPPYNNTTPQYALLRSECSAKWPTLVVRQWTRRNKGILLCECLEGGGGGEVLPLNGSSMVSFVPVVAFVWIATNCLMLVLSISLGFLVGDVTLGKSVSMCGWTDLFWSGFYLTTGFRQLYCIPGNNICWTFKSTLIILFNCLTNNQAWNQHTHTNKNPITL